MIHKPVVIVGGGPVGMVVAIKLANHGHKDITILDANPGGIQDGRVLALSYASCKLLEDIGGWDDTHATAIKQVHISHSGLGISQINAADVHLPELGYTVKYTDLCTKLHQCISKYTEIKLTQAIVKEVTPGKNYATISYKDSKICHPYETCHSSKTCHSSVGGNPENKEAIYLPEDKHLTADLVILAEGGKIKLNQVQYREHDYEQVAIITTIKTELKHNNVAYERFDDSGALVLLPHEDSYVLVWSCPIKDRDHLQNPENLLQKLKELKFMKRFGKFTIVGKVHSFPLKLQVAKNRLLDRVILVGNSAQIVHPVSAQGLNLGLRDIDALLELAGDDLTNINEYDKKRVNDSKFVIGFTHFLAKFLEAPYTKHLRGLGIMALSNCKPVQNKLANSLIFGN